MIVLIPYKLKEQTSIENAAVFYNEGILTIAILPLISLKLFHGEFWQEELVHTKSKLRETIVSYLMLFVIFIAITYDIMMAT